MQPCPRQAQEAVLPFQLEHKSHWSEDGTCSYCGSISPEMVFEAIEDGCKFGPTDKNYKVYVDLLEPEPHKLRVVTAKNSDNGLGEEEDRRQGYILSSEAKDKISEKEFATWGDYKWVKLAERGPTKFAKFYFQHFSPEDQQKFTQLYNEKKINIGYPGYFYTRLFFWKKPEEK